MSSVASQQSGTPACESFLRQGSGSIANPNQILDVVDAAITASSIVVANLGLGNAALSTQTGMTVCLNPGVGFSVRLSAAAIAGGQIVNWAVLKY